MDGPLEVIVRKTLFLALTLLMTLGAVTAPAPSAEAAICLWHCTCDGLQCSCRTGCGAPPDLYCPPCM